VEPVITPDLLDATLAVLRKHNVMTFHIESGGDKFAGTLGPEPMAPATDAAPGGWKTQPSDPQDPDPLGLGPLDAPMALDDDEVQL
jgi:hypothetical protein